MTVQSTVTALSRTALLGGTASPLSTDPELGEDTEPADASTVVRTLSGQLNQRPEGMDRWSRLDRYGRLLARLGDLALDRSRMHSGPMSGLYVTSRYSCLETNTTFDRGVIEKGPRLASPFLFPSTLPGSAASEVAMQFDLGGPYLVLPGGPATALVSLVAAVDLLAQTECRVLVASADVLGPATIRSLRDEGDAVSDHPVLAEAGAALWLGQHNDPSPGPRLRIEAAIGGPGLEGDSWAKLLEEALQRASVPADAVHVAITATANPAATKVESGAVDAVLGERRAELMRLAWRCGDAGATLGLLAVGAALEENEPALVTAADRGGSVALVIAPCGPSQ